MTTQTLDNMLKRAAEADEWSRVLRRCAWCKRIVDEHGLYSNLVPLDECSVITDGMCPACGERALAQIASRRRPLAA